MSSILDFPTIHNFLLCYECQSSEWLILWPKSKESQWYVECAECSEQYAQGLVTGLDTPSDDDSEIQNE